MDILFGNNSWAIILIAFWSLPWKGVALWKAAQKNDKKWFIALLIINTLAILDILYIFVFSKRKSLENLPMIREEKLPTEKQV
ncbi:MAG TPA: DUF5652 family protein [Candidatus Paceibacterota bacterium]